MSPGLQDDLVDRFPALFALNADWMTNGVTEHHPIACGDGWLSLIENTCQALSDLARHTTKGHMGFLSLARWMGRACVFTDRTTGQEGLLRFDLLDLDPPTNLTLTPRTRLTLQAQGMAWMACQMSESICEVCGNPGKYERNRVRCPAHQHISTGDISDYAARGAPDLIARSANPDVKGTVIRIPTRKRKPQLLKPTPRTEQKIRDLTLYDPWTRMYRAYRMGQDGLITFYTFGPLSPRDAKRIEKAYKQEN